MDIRKLHIVRQLFTAFLCLLVPAGVFSQSYNRLQELGDKEYGGGNYYTAAGYYTAAHALAPGVTSLKYRLGEALMKANCYDKAERVFRELSDKYPQKFPLAVFYDAELLKMQGRYNEAIVQYRYFYKLYTPGTEYSDKARIEIIACDFARNNALISSASIVKLPHPTNTACNELSISEYDDSVLLYSCMAPNGDTTSFSSKFYFTRHIFKYETLARKINEMGGNTSDLSLAPGHNTAYFSHCVDSSGKYLCSLYQTTFDGERWSDPRALPEPVNVPGTTSSQPFAANMQGRQYLFFVSDRSGGKGKMDIWHSEITGGQFSIPQNAGEIVNTSGDDICPFYDTVDSRLFFSSDWHKGFGGFDIYYSNGRPGTWANPLKDGLFINSSYNDLYFSISQDHERAYFSSNRDILVHEADTFHFNDFFYFNLPVELAGPGNQPAGGAKDLHAQKATAETIKSQITFYYPLQLYFDHDQPAVAMYSFQVADFGTLVEDYIDRKTAYQYEYEKIKTLMPKIIVGKEINDFFINDIERNFLKLEESLSYILDLVRAGHDVTIQLKAYTSPSGSEEYNNFVAKRRENSIVNYYRLFQGGVLVPYINKHLFFKTLPPVVQVEDQQLDKSTPEYQYSKYSTRSAFERRVDVQVLFK